MASMTGFAGDIVWSGTAQDSINDAVLTLPNGARYQLRRESRQSLVQVKNGPLFTGESKFYLVTPVGEQEFPDFDTLMIEGLKQPHEEQ